MSVLKSLLLKKQKPSAPDTPIPEAPVSSRSVQPLPRDLFNSAAYLANNPDAVDAVNSGSCDAYGH